MTQIQMKPPPVKNQAPASIQITADQILKDAEIHRLTPVTPPVQRIMDEKELMVYKQQKRREFQDKIRRQRYNLPAWVRYAQWQENLKQFARARSIYERALQIDYTNKSLWLKYAQMQMKNKFINHARNVWERATYYLPRQDQFWFKYAYMQQVIGQYIKARDVFQRWMQWAPGQKAWNAFIKFEERMGQPQKARGVLYQYLQANPVLTTYLKVAKFQLKNHNKESAREIYQKAITQLGSQALQETYFIDFGKFQIKQKQYARARQIFKFGLKHIPKEKAKALYQLFLNFEKQHGTKSEINEVILGERRNVYKELIQANRLNYDAWINLLSLEESFKNIQRIRQTYEAAVKQLPPSQQKRFWRRYMYIWYNYALFQEQIAEDINKAEEIYQRAIKLVPHKKFTFGKLWIYFAHFYIRCSELQKARKVFGKAIGLNPKEKVFKAYILMEQQLFQLERVRTLYEKYCETFPNLPQPFIQFATFEMQMGEQQRARQIIAIAHSMRIDGIPDVDQFVAENRQNQEQQNEEEQMQAQ